MLPWYSGKACEHTKRSHINMCVYDSRWKPMSLWSSIATRMCALRVKNDHIGFEITYSFKGIIHKFRPDYLSKAHERKHTLILEVKGSGRIQQQQTKREFLVRVGQGGQSARRFRRVDGRRFSAPEGTCWRFWRGTTSKF